MGYDLKTWSNPINLDSNNLNRIEQGIKTSHDTIEIISEEVSNLQTKQLDIFKEIKLLTNNTPNILESLNKINTLLQNNDISAIFSSADTFLMKTKQALSQKELEQVYKNLKLDSFIKLSSIKINGTDLENGSSLDIVLPKVDNTLNISSTNAISNMAVTKALQNVQVDVNIPKKLSELEQDTGHQTVSIQEKVKWDSYEDIINNIKETDPTVPAWAKEKTKPYYNYNEILNTPTKLSDFSNDLTFIPRADIITLINTAIDNINYDSIYAPIKHNHSEYVTSTIFETTLETYAKEDHTHSDYVLVSTFNSTINTLTELSEELNSTKNIVTELDNTIASKVDIKTLENYYTKTEIDNKNYSLELLWWED